MTNRIRTDMTQLITLLAEVDDKIPVSGTHHTDSDPRINVEWSGFNGTRISYEVQIIVGQHDYDSLPDLFVTVWNLVAADENFSSVPGTVTATYSELPAGGQNKLKNFVSLTVLGGSADVRGI